MSGGDASATGASPVARQSPCQLARLGPFLPGHLRGQRIAFSCRVDISEPSSEIEPLVGLHVVLRHSQSLNESPAQRQHCADIVRLRSLLPGGHCLGMAAGIPGGLARLVICAGAGRKQRHRRHASNASPQVSAVSGHLPPVQLVSINPRPPPVTPSIDEPGIPRGALLS